MVQYVIALVAGLMAREDECQGLVEYGLIIAFVAVACVVALTALGTSISSLLGGISFG